MSQRRNITLLSGALAVAVVGWACDRPGTPAAPDAFKPSFWEGGEQCPTLKFTGGGRIDPPDHQDTEDQDTPQSRPQMVGKVTFGFNVHLGQNQNGDCIVEKGQIQVVHHQPLPPFQVTWHVSIHNGTNEYSGEPVAARTYFTPSGGVCVVVGGGAGTTARFHAVTFGEKGTERTRMTACDNGEPGSSPGFGPDAFRWESENFGDTQLQYLTGGNIQSH